MAPTKAALAGVGRADEARSLRSEVTNTSSVKLPLPSMQSGLRGLGPEGAPPDVLTVDELAELLRVERKTAYAAIARGDIPGVRRLGRTIRISRASVLEWLGQGQVRAPRSRRIR
jgi:excisionase family DNA binding protein